MTATESMENINALLDCSPFDLILVFFVVVTPHGDDCSEEEAGKCTRRWNDFEVDGPRCRNTEVSQRREY